MPITQDRFMLLLEEAEAFKKSFDGLREDLKTVLAQCRADRQQPKAEALAYIEAYILAAARPIAEQIVMERRYFDRHYRANQRAAEKRKRQRWHHQNYVMEVIDDMSGKVSHAPMPTGAKSTAPATTPELGWAKDPITGKRVKPTQTRSEMAATAERLNSTMSDKDLITTGIFATTNHAAAAQQPTAQDVSEYTQEDLDEMERERLSAEASGIEYDPDFMAKFGPQP